jgi:hypothetical protein
MSTEERLKRLRQISIKYIKGEMPFSEYRRLERLYRLDYDTIFWGLSKGFRPFWKNLLKK